MSQTSVNTRKDLHIKTNTTAQARNRAATAEAKNKNAPTITRSFTFK